MKRKWMTRLSPMNGSLRSKLIFSTVFIAAVVSMISTVGFWNATRVSNGLLYQQTASTLGFLSDKISTRMDSITSMADAFTANITVQESLLKLKNLEDISLRATARTRVLESIFRVYQSDMINITVVPARGPVIVWGASSHQEDAEELKEILEAASRANGGVLWRPTKQGDGSALCIREIRSVADPFLAHLGYLIIRVNFNRLVKDECKNFLEATDYFIGIFNDGQRLYPAQEEGAGRLPPSTGENSYRTYWSNQGIRFVCYSNISTKNVNWEMALSIPYAQVFHSIVKTNLLFMGLLLFALLFAMGVSWRLLRSITGQFNLLVEKMRAVREGNLEPLGHCVSIYGDELGILNRQFDEMTAKFKQVIEDNYVKELLLTQTRLQSLEQQINPHFLYNSLESIRWSALRSGDSNCMVIAKSLGELLRESLSGKEAVIPVRKELGIIQNYLNIQAIRFSDTLRTQISCPEEIMDFLVPKMSVQPLIENAVIHALEENIGICTVSLRMEKNNDLLRVSVENDGSSIEESILEKLRNGQVKPNGNGIGLLNIDTRIKLLYGEQYGLCFQSRGETVTVFYEIPALLEMKDREAGEG